MFVVIAGAILPILHVEAVTPYHLRPLGGNVTLALLSDGSGDEALASLEVVVQALRFVALSSVAELRVGCSLPRAVEYVVRIDEVAVEVKAHEVRIHPLVLIVYRARAEEVGEVLPDQYHRVLRLVGDDIVEGGACTSSTLCTSYGVGTALGLR